MKQINTNYWNFPNEQRRKELSLLEFTTEIPKRRKTGDIHVEENDRRKKENSLLFKLSDSWLFQRNCMSKNVPGYAWEQNDSVVHELHKVIEKAEKEQFSDCATWWEPLHQRKRRN